MTNTTKMKSNKIYSVNTSALEKFIKEQYIEKYNWSQRALEMHKIEIVYLELSCGWTDSDGVNYMGYVCREAGGFSLWLPLLCLKDNRLEKLKRII